MSTAESSVCLVHLFELPSPMANVVQTVATARGLARLGHRVRVFVRSGDEVDVDAHLAEVYGVERGLLDVVRLPYAKGPAGIALRARLAALVAKPRPPAFLSRSRKHARLLIALRRLAGRRSRLVQEFHNLEHVVALEKGDATRARRLRASEARVCRGVDGLIAISRPLAADIAREFAPAVPLEVVEDGVDVERFRVAARAAPTRDGARIVYAGSFFAHKGVEALVRSLVELPPGVTLELVGGHPEDELDRLRAIVADSPVLRGRVEFVGAVPASEVPARLARADVIVLPAGSESAAQRYTSPLKLFEAMATGAPIVAAPTAALRSVLDEETAVLAPAITAAGLAAGIGRVLEAPDRARAIGRRAAAEAERYDWPRRAQRISTFLDSLEA